MGYLLILGAGSGTARALAQKYASEGQDLYLADKNPESLEEIQQVIIDEHGVDVHILKFDVTEFYNHRNFYNSLSPKPFGVICAVDYQGDGLRAQKDFLEAKRIIDINYTGVVAILNIIANDFEDREAGYITVVSYAGNEKDENAYYLYKSAKEAMNTYASGLHNRLGKAGVNVLTALQGLKVSEPGKFAEKIFNAQQKGREVVYLRESKDLATLVKGIKWK